LRKGARGTRIAVGLYITLSPKRSVHRLVSTIALHLCRLALLAFSVNRVHFPAWFADSGHWLQSTLITRRTSTMVVQHRQRPPNKPFNPFGRGGSGPSLSYNDTRYRHTASRNTFRNAAGANARGSFSGCLSPAVLFVLVVIATISSYGFMSTPEPNGPVATSDKQEGGGIGAGALSPTKSASGALDKYGKSQSSGSARQSDSAMQKSGHNEYAEPEFPYHEQRDTNVQAYSYGDAAEEVAFPEIPPDLNTRNGNPFEHHRNQNLEEDKQGGVHSNSGPSADLQHRESQLVNEERQGDFDVKTGPSEDSEHVVSLPLTEEEQGDLDVKTGPSEDSEHFVSLPLTEEKQGDLDVKTGPSEDRDHIGSPPLVEEEQDDEASNRGSSAYHERTTNKSLAEEEQGDEESKTRPSDDPDHEGADQNDPDADEAKGLLPQIDSNDTVVTDVSIEKMRFKDEPSYLLQNAEEGKVQDNIEVERFGHLPPGMLDTETSLGKNFLSNETIEEDSFPSPVEISQAGNVTDAHSIAADINSTQPYLQANDTGFAGRHTIQSIAKTYANKSGTFVSENKFNTMFAGPTGAHDKSPIIEIPSIVDVIDGNFENKGNSSKLKSAYVVSKEADETDSLAGNASSSAETSPMTSERGSEPWSMESINNSLITKPVAASELEHKHVKDLVQINRISEESGGTQYKKSLNGGEDDTENLSTHSKLNVVPSTFFNESALTSPEAFVMSKLTSNHSGWPDPVTPASLVERREMDANVTQLYSTGSSYMSIATEKNATGVAKTLTKSAKRKPFENTTEHVNIKGYLKADGATRPKTMIATTAKSNITNIAVSQASLSASDANVTEWQSEALRNISKTDRDHPHRSLNLSAATFHQESVLRNKTHKFLHDKKTRHSHGKSPDKTRSSNKEKQIDTTDKNSALSPTRNTTLVVKEVKKQSREQDDPHLHDDDTGQHSESRNTTILKMHKSSARKSLRVKSS
jgi:hypothetical protein